MKVLFCTALIFFFLLTGSVGAQDAATLDTPSSVKTDINAPFLDPNLDVDEWVQRFEGESREIFRSREKIVELIGLKSGDTIADVGTGTGLFVESFSKSVGKEGQVFALDIAPAFIERVGTLAAEHALHNVTPVLTAQDEVRLPSNCLDAAFICDTYHHFEHPESTLASLIRSMKHGGRLVVIDFVRIPGVSREWTLDHVRAGKDVFKKEIEEEGFEFVEEIEVPGFEENYFLRFRRP